MKKLLLGFGFILVSLFENAQSIDTVIHTNVFTSYFSYGYKEPLIVSYKLFHAGGDCDRSGDRFKNDIPTLETATQKQYAGSGYDEGHLADSKDFAYDCKLQEATFRFYNCVPQTPNLNRGTWKHWETEIRKESQDDSLLVIAGSVFTGAQHHGLYVPSVCWKVVKSLTDETILHVLYCTNDATNATCEDKDLPFLYQNISHEEGKELKEILK